MIPWEWTGIILSVPALFQVGSPGLFPGPTQRPKLNLKPRSAPKEEETSAAPAAQSSRAASIFGGAKPVDTAAREREVEERLQKEQEKLQRQLEDDKRIDRRPRERWEWCLGKEGVRWG